MSEGFSLKTRLQFFILSSEETLVRGSTSDFDHLFIWRQLTLPTKCGFNLVSQEISFILHFMSETIFVAQIVGLVYFIQLYVHSSQAQTGR